MNKGEVRVLVASLYIIYPASLAALFEEDQGQGERAVSEIIDAIKAHTVRGHNPFSTVADLEDALEVGLAHDVSLRHATRLADDLKEIITKVLHKE